MFQFNAVRIIPVSVLVLAVVQRCMCTNQLSAKQSFGQTCNSTVDCDSSQGLTCGDDSVCECINKDELAYDKSLRKCVVPAGGHCNLFSHENGNCVAGATCKYRQGGLLSHDTNVCTCDTTEYFQTEENFCEPVRCIHEPCDGDEQCRGLLECDAVAGYICTCSGRNKYDALSKKCITDIGHTVHGYCNDQNIGCGRGTHCHVKSYDRIGPNSYQCKCLSGYQELQGNRTKNGHCYGHVGATCTSDFFGEATEKQCLPGLYCVNGQCQCKYGSFHQTYVSETEQCLSLLGSPCLEPLDCKDPGSICGNSTGTSQCSCKAGLLEYKRDCYKGFGQTCAFNERPECDILSGLECSYKGICECPELQGFNDITGKCMALVGASCSLKDSTKSCWPGSVCTPFRGLEDSDYGLCVWESWFKNVSGRKCYS